MTVHEHTNIGEGGRPAGDFTLGDWLVQPSLNRASRDGVTIHLRPQLVDVLVCLASCAGQTVARGDILDRVWPKQSIADTALARCVAELRQALGDNAQSPTLIETIPKRGYRLIAPVLPRNSQVPSRPLPSPPPAVTQDGLSGHRLWWRLRWLRRWATTLSVIARVP